MGTYNPATLEQAHGLLFDLAFEEWEAEYRFELPDTKACLHLIEKHLEELCSNIKHAADVQDPIITDELHSLMAVAIAGFSMVGGNCSYTADNEIIEEIRLASECLCQRDYELGLYGTLSKLSESFKSLSALDNYQGLAMKSSRIIAWAQMAALADIALTECYGWTLLPMGAQSVEHNGT